MRVPMRALDSQQSAKQAKHYSEFLMKEPTIAVEF